MKKFILIFAALCGTATMALAQITEGEPSAKKVRTGNRPEAGNFGLYIGVGSKFTEDNLSLVPIINFKYMKTDKLEFRASIGADTNFGGMKGDRYTGGVGSSTNPYVNNTNHGGIMLQPGFAYHFSPFNILDVYAGAEIPLGWDIDSATGNGSAPGDITKVQKTAFCMGANAFIGLQAFIANLPFAIGVEYGLGLAGYFGNKYKITETTSSSKQVYYTDTAKTSMYAKLLNNKGAFSQQVCLTFSYYFK